MRKVRVKKGMTQDFLAEKCGFYRTYINLIETANRTPSSYSLHRISKALGVKIGELYPNTD